MVIDKDNIKILLFILVLVLGIGCAYINSDLNINGTAQINSSNWDVHCGEEYVNGTYREQYCNVSGLNAHITTYGHASANTETSGCSVFDAGYSACGTI